VQPEEYTAFGEVFEFAYARDLGPQLLAGRIYDPDLSEVRPGHVPAASAVVFVDNHDTERGEASVTYRDGPLYLLANVLMLADDYGTPVVYSGYAFDDRDAGAPADAEGRVIDAACDGVDGPAESAASGARTCVHAWSAVSGMLEWRAAVGDAPRGEGVAEADAYGFERDGRGVVAVNLGEEETILVVPTSLPGGAYCDVVSGGASADRDDCGGARIDVADGSATFVLPPRAAAAIHIGSGAP
jgi:alpha-amylase